MPIDNLLPHSLVEQIGSTPRSQFCAQFANTRFLLVRLEGRPALVQWLEATGNSRGAELSPTRDSISYATGIANLAKLKAGMNVVRTPQALAQVVKRERWFAAALRKRADGGSKSFIDRISIGRATNNDIVLRDPTVSKFHAWFECDDEGQFYLADGHSTNGTRLNGNPLAKQPERVGQGDEIAFGDVQAMLCNAELLWDLRA